MANHGQFATPAWPVVDTDQDTSKEVTSSHQHGLVDTSKEAYMHSTLQVLPESYKNAHNPEYAYAETIQPPVVGLNETDLPRPRPWWKRRRIWIAAIGGVLVVVAIVVGCVVGLGARKSVSSGDSSPVPNNNSTGNSPNGSPDPNFRSVCRGTTCGQLFTAQKFVDEKLHLFGRGRDGAMWTRVYDGSSWTGSWTSLGGSFQSQPESVYWGLNRRRISVFGVSSDDGKMMTRAYRDGTWDSDWLYLNATTNSPITACFIPFRDGSDWVDIFARSPIGSEKGLMTSRMFGEDDPLFKKLANQSQYYEKWETHYVGGNLGSSVAIACRVGVSGVPQDMIMYQRGTRSVAHTQRLEPGAKIVAWDDRGGSFAGEPVIVATSNSETDPKIDFFGTGQDKNIYHFGWSKATNYTTMENIGGEFESVPAVVVTTSARLDVLAVGTDDRLKHRAYISGQWAGDWEDLGVLANSAPYAVALPSSPYKIGVFILGKDNDVLFSTWEVSASPSWKNLAKFVSIQGNLTASWMESEP